MGSSTTRRVLAAIAVSLVVLAFNAHPADAARPAPEALMRLDGGEEAVRHGSGCHTTATVGERAKETLQLLRARLPAGPSPKGPGH
ncbi:hypothetical protein EJB05_47910, partial [Eragrostis curvula]